MILFAAGCASVSSVNDYCLIATPPVFTDEDVSCISNELARWILEHGDTYDKLCKAN